MISDKRSTTHRWGNVPFATPGSWNADGIAATDIGRKFNVHSQVVPAALIFRS